MVFRTELNINKSAINIDYRQRLLFLGSCFSDSIGDKFGSLGFNSMVNPFGTIFNISSILLLIEMAYHQRKISDEQLDYNQDIYSHRDFHSSYNSTSSDVTLERINQSLIEVHEYLMKTDVVFITLGTAWVYRTKDDGHIVSNCHKRPSTLFDKELLKTDIIISQLESIIQLLKSINASINIIFTISPVRHIKDGIIENQVSKSMMVNAIYDICNRGLAQYFPAYEIMLDDLRDYRFYKEDMIHPNDQAISYIWEKLSYHYFNDHTTQIIQRVSKIVHFLNHRNGIRSQSYIDHMATIKNEMSLLQEQEGVDFTKYYSLTL